MSASTHHPFEGTANRSLHHILIRVMLPALQASRHVSKMVSSNVGGPEMTMTMTKKIIRAIAQVVGGAIIGVVIVVLGWRYVVDPLQYRVEFWLEPFNSAVWKAEKPTGEIQHTKRRCMIRDLSRHYLKKGMTRAEVIVILGEPRGLYGSQVMDYWLGYPRWGLTLDDDILEIQLDDAGKVVAWKVRNT